MSENDTERYGPAEVMCPFCKGMFTVSAGPTPRVEVDHCDEGWFVADLRTGKTGYKEPVSTEKN